MAGKRSLLLIGSMVMALAFADARAWAGSEVLSSAGRSTAAAFCPATADENAAALGRHESVMGAASGISSIRADAAPARVEQDERRFRVGSVVQVGSTVEFAGLRAQDFEAGSRPHASGEIQALPSGGFSWFGAVESSDATALRLHLSGFYLPRNAALYLHGETGEVFGPYSGRGPLGGGTFWSHTLLGSRVVLEVRYEGGDTQRALGAARFEIASLGHLTSDFRFAEYRQPGAGAEAGSDLCADNAACVTNASCNTLSAPLESARDAVAHIQFVSGAFLYLCSGGLVADTDSGSDVPYFLTANHCLSRNNEAASLEAYFQFETACGGSCVLGTSVPRTLGSAVMASNKTGDYTLLRLSEAAPTGSHFLGWNAQQVAFAGGTPLFRIHHPKGAPQAYSEHVVDTGRDTCRSWPRGSWIYSSDTLGATEGGSSGSPVLDANGNLVGQLSGGCGYNVSEVCDSASNATVDGAFEGYFSSVAPFLDPSDSCTDLDGDSFCSEVDDCNDADPTVNPAANEVCDDGIDNDCNGLSDSEDAACQTGSCDLTPVGGSCSVDSECCTGKCRGRSGGTLCR